MIKFVPSDADGLPQKRAGSQRACESCRKRKKRCEHVNSNDALSHQPSSSPKRIRLSQRQNQARDLRDTPGSRQPSKSVSSREHHTISDSGEPSINSVSTSTAITSSYISNETERNSSSKTSRHYGSNEQTDESRFVGHLNPEATFLAAISPTGTAGCIEPDEVGVWLSEKSRTAKPKYYSSLPLKKTQSDSIYVPDLVISRLFLSHFEDQCLSLLPDSADFEALNRIYFDEIHPIFPILDRRVFEELSPTLPTTVVLKQVVCLAASSSWSSKPFLNFSVDGHRISTGRKEFALQLSLAARTSINLGLVKDKFALTQILALLSMSMQFSNDRHISAELTGRAVSYVQTLGLHILTKRDIEDEEHVVRTFCCVWALDRLNAAFHGRPVLIHDRDLGRDVEKSISAQDSCFQLFLRTILLLEKIIHIYRPNLNEPKPTWENDFPHFETLIHEAGASHVRHNLLATVETLYHAVAMLSCRSHNLQEPMRSSSSYVRQNLSASKVTSMVAEDFHGRLSLLPIVPYSVSLALRVFYRELRFTKVPLFRSRARRQLQMNCTILRELGEIFGVASSIADLAEQTLSEMDKAYSSIVQQQESKNGEENGEQHMSLSMETSRPLQSPATPISVTLAASSIDWATWDNIPDFDFDIFQHFDPNFDLDAVDAALADGTQAALLTDYDHRLMPM